jgi:hypothetical protein
VVISIQFIYLRAELNSQWPVTESARIQATRAITKHKQKTKTKETIKNGLVQAFYIQTIVTKNIYRFTDCIMSRYTFS